MLLSYEHGWSAARGFALLPGNQLHSRREERSKGASRRAGDQLKALEGKSPSHHPKPKGNISP